MRRHLLAVVFPALLACSPLETVPAHPMAPPTELPAWWAELEACAGQQRPIPAVTWWEVPGWGFKVNGHWVAAHTDSESEIWVAASWLQGDSATRAFVVKHELLHLLLYPVAGHPEAFRNCGLLWSVPEGANVVD